MGDFTNTIAGFEKEAPDKCLAVFRHAVTLLARELIRTRDDGGALPKVTGNLARSLLAQIGSMPSEGGPGAQFGGADVGAIVAQALVSDTIYLGYQANYARRRNYGFVGQDSLGRTYNEAGAHFVERAVEMWPELVNQAIREVTEGVGV